MPFIMEQLHSDRSGLALRFLRHNAATVIIFLYKRRFHDAPHWGDDQTQAMATPDIPSDEREILEVVTQRLFCINQFWNTQAFPVSGSQGIRAEPNTAPVSGDLVDQDIEIG